MFSDFVEVRAGEAGRKRWAVVVSIVLQAVTLLALLLMPLMFTQALPALLNFRASVAAPVPLVEAPKPPKALSQHASPIRHSFFTGGFYAPTSFPARPLMLDEPEPPPEMPVNGADFGVGDVLDFTTGRREAEPPPVVPPPMPRIRKIQIEEAMILAQPQPVYPPLAVIAKIQGDVLLHAIIDREGRIAELQVISGHPLLVQAALAAVRTWRYRPTLLNGQPVEVETTIKVSFSLGG